MSSSRRAVSDLPRSAKLLQRRDEAADQTAQSDCGNQKGIPQCRRDSAPDFDPVAIARAYEAAGADALSVLTDEQYFQGHLSFIQSVRDAVELPVLRKDFIINEYQVYESRVAGADAILLIAECLEMSRLIDLQILATELNMTCLIEVHDMENLIRVRDRVIGFPHKSYSLIGINNRDLRTFRTDLGTTLRLAELIENRNVLVSESGINNRFDVDKLVDAGVRAILVGESLMRSDDIQGKSSPIIGLNSRFFNFASR